MCYHLLIYNIFCGSPSSHASILRTAPGFACSFISAKDPPPPLNPPTIPEAAGYHLYQKSAANMVARLAHADTRTVIFISYFIYFPAGMRNNPQPPPISIMQTAAAGSVAELNKMAAGWPQMHDCRTAACHSY